jgi:hypothetical protein
VKAVSDGNFDDLRGKIKGLTYGCVPDIETKCALVVTFCFNEVSADPDGRDCAFNAHESVRHAGEKILHHHRLLPILRL